ncbi:MAG: hypothetical protein SH847_06145 [Roseiflexaceae bacterium]|nr:hypothetical protein [Roseiflexaceae bacterium]
MQFRAHLVAAAAAGLALYPRSLRRAALTALGGVLIDIDHFLLYALRSGDWSLDGALRYDKRRHIRIRPGDTRPRYGSLRSMTHRPWFSLPIMWMLAYAWPGLRPLAIGLTIHLAMDTHLPHYDRQAWKRAGGRCERCNLPGLELEVYWIVLPEHGGDRIATENHAVWCAACAREVYRSQ